eukprot:g27720.t1
MVTYGKFVHRVKKVPIGDGKFVHTVSKGTIGYIKTSHSNPTNGVPSNVVIPLLRILYFRNSYDALKSASDRIATPCLRRLVREGAGDAPTLGP